jgi:hypothetical protein
MIMFRGSLEEDLRAVEMAPAPRLYYDTASHRQRYNIRISKHMWAAAIEKVNNKPKPYRRVSNVISMWTQSVGTLSSREGPNDSKKIFLVPVGAFEGIMGADFWARINAGSHFFQFMPIELQ